MLIAPFSPSSVPRSRVSIRSMPSAAVSAPPGVLMAWLAFGIGIVLCVPIARGDRVLGATLPFWLVAAPLINLAWVLRRHIARRMSEWLSIRTHARRASRNVRAQRAPRAACNAARS